MVATVVGEKAYPLRIPPDLYDAVRRLAQNEERSANWMMVRLLREAVEAREKKSRLPGA